MGAVDVDSQFEATAVMADDDGAVSEPAGWRGLLSRVLGRSGNKAAPLKAAGTECGTMLYNQQGLLAHGEMLLAACRGERRDLTLAVFDCDDLVEARQLYGDRTGRKLIGCIIARMTLLAGERGLAGRTGPTQFSVVLPMGRDQAVEAIERVLGNPGRIELEAGNSELVLVPNIMVEAVPDTGSVEHLFAALGRGLTRLREEEQLRHRQLERERERQRHSRPMPVQADEPAPQLEQARRAPRLAPDSMLGHHVPNTIPMPLQTP